MIETIKVHVVKYPNRDNLVMRYRCPITGKQVAKTSGTPRRKEAEKRAAKWEAEIQEGRYHKPGRMSWEDFKERYREQVAREKAPRTGEKVESMFNVVETIIRPATIGDVTQETVATLKRDLLKGRSTSTVQGYLAHLRAALSAAVEWGALPAVPLFPKVRTPKGTKLMKGRPITLEEFERMLAAVPVARPPYDPETEEAPSPLIPEHAVASWRFLLRGLWLSGLRLGEACDLYWTGHRGHLVDFSGRYPMMLVRGELEKGKRDRLLPLAPEFCELLASVPAEARKGRVFRPQPKRTSKNGPAPIPDRHRVGEIIGAIGRTARVVVDSDPRTGEPRKHATAHDLRRAFGQRWAHKVPAATLMELMRHESIETTKKFYVGENADATAAVLWGVAGRDPGSISGNSDSCRVQETLVS